MVGLFLGFIPDQILGTVGARVVFAVVEHSLAQDALAKLDGSLRLDEDAGFEPLL